MLKTNLPVFNNSDIILFPLSEIKLEINDENIKKCLSISEKYYNNYLLFVQKINDDKVGVVAKIMLNITLPNGNNKITLKGIERVNVLKYNRSNDIFDAIISKIDFPKIDPVESIAKANKLKEIFEKFLEDKKSLGNSILSRIEKMQDIKELTDIIADFLPMTVNQKKNLLEEIDASKRVELLIDNISYESKIAEYENSLDEIVEHNLAVDQKKFVLKEKLRLIQNELGLPENSEATLLKEKIDKLDCPIRVKRKLNEELERFKICNSNSPEIGIIKNYIDTLLSLPWSVSTRENIDLDSIRQSLDDSHYGLEEVKERIIEFMATKKHTKTKSNPIICLVGPPGIGKTSLAKAISVALKRKCVKISVGGINDEAEITGHRRAYVGALPGKIITSMIKAGVNNPVFIIDEIDKMTKDIKGDPASSLLEVLDKEQNERFTDHFIEEEFDLSKVLFILTANYVDNIPSELRDRLEIIKLSSYTSYEKCAIVKNCLLKKLRLEYHLTKQEINLSDEDILYIINHYTRESGIRELERLIRRICRKYIYYKLQNNHSLDMSHELKNLLGKEKYDYQENYPNEIGMINALSYHELGGELVKIESAYYDGDGKISTSGSLGDVMQESIKLAFAYIKAHAKKFKISLDVFKKNDFFIHLTNGGIKKDGPSAGVNFTTALLSLLKGIVIPQNIAMTGEITLSGKILKVGGLKEKIILALENNINKVYIPKDNKNDVLSFKELYDGKIEIILVDDYLDIYSDLFKK